MKQPSLTVERLFPSGMWEVSTIICNQYIRERYMGFTKREAMREFRAMLRERENTIIRGNP